MLLWLLRGFFGIIVVGLATTVLLDFIHRDQNQLGVFAFIAILAIGLLIVIIDLSIRNKQITTISAVYFGLLLGFVLGNLLWTAVEPFVIEEDISLGPVMREPAKTEKGINPGTVVSPTKPKLTGPVLM